MPARQTHLHRQEEAVLEFAVEESPEAMATVMQSKVSEIGTEVDFVNVQIGPQFLNLFSEHLYSSPNKAFEELVANSWDAGAGCVYIHLPGDLQSPSAAIWVLDNGVSMDVEGFRALWSVATSPKRHGADVGRRQPIGKFGVGKLATYLLAHELTYVCRASDGIVRAITMDYRRIDGHDRSRLHIDPVPLQVREVRNSALSDLLASLPDGGRLRRLIAEGVPTPEDADFEDEFGGAESPPDTCSGTWTLAVLSSLKEPGRRLGGGWIRRLLRTALPLGRSITIVFNDELLS
jgi:Histidine kinase-, DNA gyrase B-, and HSP90-like ATPase